MTAGPQGLLVVDKPPGCTSHDVVADARRLFQTRSVGHAGTLDPLASGVLLLLFGEACKLSSHLTLHTKAYRTTVLFGVATDSFDADGEVLATRELAPDWLDMLALEAALGVERARTLQVPPAISAIHERGERAYQRARRGETVELAPRHIAVDELTLIDVGASTLTLELHVSKGYYVRALARDLGASLGAPAHLTELRRLASGPFSLSEAVPWPPERVPELLPVVDAARRALPITQLSEVGAAFARHGKALASEHAVATRLDAVSAWLSPDGALIALGTSSHDGSHRVVRGFNPGA
jgi:tRNA pseudouridine55 synthase